MSPSGHANWVLGNAAITRILHEKRGNALWQELYMRVSADHCDAPAFLDLSTILYLWGRHEDAAPTQMAALSTNKNYRIDNGNGTGLKVLVFSTAGDPNEHTPIEFLLESSNTSILLHYVDANTTALEEIPEHDVAFLAIGRSAEHRTALEQLDPLLRSWPRPIINGSPQQIFSLSRYDLPNVLREEPTIAVPEAIRMVRHELAAIALQEPDIAFIAGIISYPCIIRPVGAPLDVGIEIALTGVDISAHLTSRPEQEFSIAPFIDYRDKDGKYRRRRVVFINGVAFPVCLAISDHWVVPFRRTIPNGHAGTTVEESAWMANFEIDFAVRHARSLDALHRRFGLDYFAIDCAELADGRLLLFEVDVGLTLHMADPEGPLPYQEKAMNRIFKAFENALTERVRRATLTTEVTCAHTGKHAVYQRTAHDCLICALAMFTGRTYEEIIAIASDCNPAFPLVGPMSHSIMRGVADTCGLKLFSGIYMLWERPAIIGVVSPTILDSGHAVFWDGEKLIDPGFCGRVDRSYVDRCGVEFIQTATDLVPLVFYETQISGSVENSDF